MPGDFSRKTFDRKKHYSGVLMQQGRVQLDADWNEELDIEQYRIFTETKDVIGPAGVPKKNGGFKITVAADGTDLIIAPGRIYVEGLLCELEPGLTSYKNQPYYPSPDLSDFNLPGSPPLSPVGSPPSANQLKDGNYLVYLKAWQREINYLDDPAIQEKALGEADTTTRLQTVWQVKLLKVEGNNSLTCKSTFNEWNQLTAPLTGLLNAQTKPPEDDKNPCVLPPKAGYLRLENQLYRIEVQTVDGAKKATSFKWSRDNASIETIIENVSGKTLTVSSIGKDDVLGFEGNQWVEIVDDVASLNGKPNQLVQIDFITPDAREINLKTAVTQFEGKKGLKLRRWDISGITASAIGLPVSAGWLEIEDGIQVAFNNGTYEPGDFWLLPARTSTGTIEWPLTNPGGLSIPQPRTGIAHYYCRLGIAKVQAGVVTIEDCRPLFPSLTEICAEDICYNNKNCTDSTAKNVQEALDELCRKRDTGCTYMALPGPGWEAVFDKIEKGKDAQVCFQVGIYPLQRPVIISDKGNVKLIGCGPGTRIVSPNTEAALVFNQCKAINMRDLYGEGGLADPKNKAFAEHLNGVFTFINCEAVNIDHVGVRSGNGNTRTATCITVHNTIKNPCPVRIEDCDLQIADKQQGILLLNISRCWVENNSLTIFEKPAGVILSDAAKSKILRAGIRKVLMSGASAGNSAAGANNVAIAFGGFRIQFTTEKSVKTAWQNLFAANPPQRVNTAKELQLHVKKLADRLITEANFRDRFPAFTSLFQSLLRERTIASAGITIGGEVGTDIQIENNVITGVLQGIHIGMSHASVQRQPDTAGNIHITGNSIYVIYPAVFGKQDRYGIFVGNCKSLIVEDNTIELERIGFDDRNLIDGIRVWGILGNRLMVTKNFIHSSDGNSKNSFNTGIRIKPLIASNSNCQWVVMWNVAPSRSNTVLVSNGAVNVPGTNTP